MLKLFEFSGAETDWVAANDEAEARRALINHYGITEADMTGSYESIAEVDPNEVEFYTDAIDAETEESRITPSSASISQRCYRASPLHGPPSPPIAFSRSYNSSAAGPSRPGSRAAARDASPGI